MFLESFIKTLTGVNFRNAPVDGSVIKVLSTGTVLEVIGVDKVSGWYSAKLSDGTTGFITNKPAYVVNVDPAWLKVIRQVVTFGETFLPKDGQVVAPYDFGSSRTNSDTFDCSDFVQWIYKKYGYPLDWTSRSQSDDGTPSDLNNLRSGDLIFFARTDGYIHHVAMYVQVDGKDRLLHTYNTDCDAFDRNLVKLLDNCGGVTFSDFSVGSYWRGKASFATRRIVQGDRFAV
jgi:hypothetical protein